MTTPVMDAARHIGRSIIVRGLMTNYHEAGEGSPVLLLHGSGPGVTAWANWQRIIPRLATRHRVIAPDIVGFGFSTRPSDGEYNIKLWVEHLLGILDALQIARVAVVGNSFGGGLALAACMRHQDRFEKLVLMGTPAGTFAQTPGLRAGWDYEPSLENMERMLRMFPYDQAIVTESMVHERHRISLLHGGQTAFRKLIPKPAPDGEVTLIKGVPDEALRKITLPALILHGREDAVVPPACAMTLHQNLKTSQLHMFGECGHWVQAEREDDFLNLVTAFLGQGAAA